MIKLILRWTIVLFMTISTVYAKKTTGLYIQRVFYRYLGLYTRQVTSQSARILSVKLWLLTNPKRRYFAGS
jgi:hypothetical protein